MFLYPVAVTLFRYILESDGVNILSRWKFLLPLSLKTNRHLVSALHVTARPFFFLNHYAPILGVMLIAYLLLARLLPFHRKDSDGNLYCNDKKTKDGPGLGTTSHPEGTSIPNGSLDRYHVFFWMHASQVYRGLRVPSVMYRIQYARKRIPRVIL